MATLSQKHNYHIGRRGQLQAMLVLEIYVYDHLKKKHFVYLRQMNAKSTVM